jgi:hypothetical protein
MTTRIESPNACDAAFSERDKRILNALEVSWQGRSVMAVHADANNKLHQLFANRNRHCLTQKQTQQYQSLKQIIGNNLDKIGRSAHRVRRHQNALVQLNKAAQPKQHHHHHHHHHHRRRGWIIAAVVVAVVAAAVIVGAAAAAAPAAVAAGAAAGAANKKSDKDKESKKKEPASSPPPPKNNTPISHPPAVQTQQFPVKPVQPAPALVSPAVQKVQAFPSAVSASVPQQSMSSPKMAPSSLVAASGALRAVTNSSLPNAVPVSSPKAPAAQPAHAAVGKQPSIAAPILSTILPIVTLPPAVPKASNEEVPLSKPHPPAEVVNTPPKEPSKMQEVGAIALHSAVKTVGLAVDGVLALTQAGNPTVIHPKETMQTAWRDKAVPALHEKIDKLCSTNMAGDFDPKKDPVVAQIAQSVITNPVPVLNLEQAAIKGAQQVSKVTRLEFAAEGALGEAATIGNISKVGQRSSPLKEIGAMEIQMNKMAQNPQVEAGRKVEFFENNVKHIFRNSPGHLTDTPANRQLLIDVASNAKNYLGKDKFGHEWYAKVRDDGSQVWVRVLNGEIRNGGLNPESKSFQHMTDFERKMNE